MSTMNIYDMADTWNDGATTFTAIKMDVTDTASASDSLLMDLQVGGVSRFKVSKAGEIDALQLKAIGTNPAKITVLTGFGSSSGIKFSTYNQTGGAAGTNTAAMYLSNSTGYTLSLVSSGSIAFSSTSTIQDDADVVLRRDAANTLAQRNGVNAQAFRVYNTFTDASNYERGVFAWIGNDLKIGTENAGTGSSARQTHLYGGGQIRLYTGNLLRWYVDSAGNFLAGTDNTYDIGGNGNARPRDGYFGRNLWTGAGSWLLALSTGGGSNAARFSSPSDGVVTWTNFATTDFDRLQFGGTTSSFPALKRSTTSLQARLADDSAFTNIQGKITTETAYTAGVPIATGYIVLYDSTGTAYKIPAEAL